MSSYSNETADRKPASLPGLLFAITGCSCWGFSGLFAKLLFEDKSIPAMWLVTVRLITAGLILLAITFIKNRPGFYGPWSSRKDIRDLLIFALFGMMPSQTCYFLAIHYSNPAAATVLQYVSPVLIMVFFFARQHRFPQIHEILILITVMTGVFLMSTHGRLSSLAISPAALFWGLTAAFAVAIYTLQPARLVREYGTMAVVGWGMLLGGILLLPFTRIWIVPGIWDRETILLTGLVVVVGTVLAFSCYLQGVKMLGPVEGSMVAGLEPVVSMLVTVLFLHVAFTGMDLLGMLLVIGGVTAVAFFRGR